MKQILTLLLIICNLNPFFAQESIHPTANPFVSEANLKHASIGFCLIDVKTDSIIQSINPDQALIPASSLKTLTTASALQILGEDFQYSTVLQYSGLIQDEVLDGNICIKGSGDPTLGSGKMSNTPDYYTIIDSFVSQIKQLGITTINGGIIADPSIFETAAVAPTWMFYDIGNYYGAGSFGLNFNENQYQLTFEKGRNLGDIPKIQSTNPEIPNLKFINELKSAGTQSGDNAYIYGVPYNFTNYIRGTIPKGTGTFKIKGAIPNPPLLVAELLSKRLLDMGISVCENADVLSELNTDLKIDFYTHHSPTLKEIVYRTNQKSINLYAESLLKTIGKGSRTKGIDKIIDYWTQKGVYLSGLHLEDGSGLSPRNSVSAYHLASIMAKMHSNSNFKNSLPELSDGILAKSGYMDRVRSYTGFIETTSGRKLAYSLIINNYLGNGHSVKKVMKKYLSSIAKNNG